MLNFIPDFSLYPSSIATCSITDTVKVASIPNVTGANFLYIRQYFGLAFRIRDELKEYGC